jgi:hypothetical protein
MKKNYIIVVLQNNESQPLMHGNPAFYQPNHVEPEPIPYIKSDKFAWHFLAVSMTLIVVYVAQAWHII